MDQDNLNRIIEMAWEDRTPFDVIYKEFDITQNDLERLMRNNLKPSSFKLWRKRVHSKSIKNRKLFSETRRKMKRNKNFNFDY